MRIKIIKKIIIAYNFIGIIISFGTTYAQRVVNGSSIARVVKFPQTKLRAATGNIIVASMLLLQNVLYTKL